MAILVGGIGREAGLRSSAGRSSLATAPVAKKRVELNRSHGLPLWALNEGGTVPAPSRAGGEWLEGR